MNTQQHPISQDSAEKENPLIAMKNTTVNFLKANLQQNHIVCGDDVADRIILPLKKEKSDRTSLKILTTNTIAQAHPIIGKNLLLKNSGNIAAMQAATVLPFEQFKSLAIYDSSNKKSNSLLQQYVAKSYDKNVADMKIDKINIYDALVKSNKEFDGNVRAATYADAAKVSSVHAESINVAADSNENEKFDKKFVLSKNVRERFFEVVEYQQAILEFLRDSEKKHRPKAHYMKHQSDINNAMRAILVGWLIGISEEFKLNNETLFLTVSYIDRFLSKMSVVANKLQLLGIAAINIAAKYEEVYPPHISKYITVTNHTYLKAQILRMEQIILKVLSFNLCTPTAYVFLNIYAVLHAVSNDVKNLAQYICELSLFDVEPYLRYHPSIISAASLALARYLLKQPIWSLELEDITTYKLKDMKELICALSLTHLAAKNLEQKAILLKYNADKYLKVASIQPIAITPNALDEIIRVYVKQIIHILIHKRMREQQKAVKIYEK